MDKHSNKDYLLNLLKNKSLNGLSFSTISELTGYSISYVKKLYKSIEEKDMLIINQNDTI